MHMGPAHPTRSVVSRGTYSAVQSPSLPCRTSDRKSFFLWQSISQVLLPPPKYSKKVTLKHEILTKKQSNLTYPKSFSFSIISCTMLFSISDFSSMRIPMPGDLRDIFSLRQASWLSGREVRVIEEWWDRLLYSPVHPKENWPSYFNCSLLSDKKVSSNVDWCDNIEVR